MEFLGYQTDTRVEQSVVALPVMCKVIDDMCIIELHDIYFTPFTDASNIIQISSVPCKLICNSSHV